MTTNLELLVRRLRRWDREAASRDEYLADLRDRIETGARVLSNEIAKMEVAATSSEKETDSS